MGRRTQEEVNIEAKERLQQAIACKLKHKLQDAPPVTASCAVLGSRYGVGVGLYFQILSWLRWLIIWLALCMVPFMIVVNTARWTTADYKGKPDGPAVSMLPSFSILRSLTFAAVPDDEADKGMLSWMNILLPGFSGAFPMPRRFFLAWISLMDAGSMAVFSFACLVLYKLAAKFAKAVDKATMEVADYTVLIKGLPETTPIDIGHHFSRFGRVMDVVPVKDFGPLLNLAATATSLEQQRKAAETKLAHGRKAAKRQHRVHKLEKKMGRFMQQATKQLDSSGFVMKAVFVTFHTEAQAAACMAACPRRWLSSWFQRRNNRFLGKYRFWVEAAKPPEDYIYENLSYPRWARYLRMAIVRLVVFAILVASAGAVTKLMAMNMEATRNVVWDNAAMESMINLNMRVYPLQPSDALLASAAGNATIDRIAAAVGDEAAAQLDAAFGAQVSYCSVRLEGVCSTGMSRLLGGNGLLMRAAEGVTWANFTDSLLKREAFLTQLPACSKPGSGCTSLAMCYPCHCSMLSKVAPAKVVDTAFVAAMRQECGGLIQTLDIHSYTMKGLISGVIVLLNFVLKSILQLLVEFEKHWTQSDKERAYAVLAFVSQLLNSVLVLLLVNAQSSIASAVINGALNRGTASRYTSWGTNLILSGAYTDFSPSWYTDVGQSLQLLIIINAVVTAGFCMAMWLLRKVRQYCLVTCFKTASQSAWNAAWIGMDFVLDARVSDIMLGLWIILMFGTGMPSLYLWGLIWLVVVELADRWSLAIVCRTPARYGKSLPFLLLGVLPWAAATHCAFGLWMHTRFQTGHIGSEQISNLASSAGGAAQAFTDTYYFKRVTQVNGLPLLVLLIVHLGMHVLIRFMIYFFGKACCCCFKDDGNSTESGVTYEQALLARYAQDDNHKNNNHHSSGGGDGAGGGSGSGSGSRSHSVVHTRPTVALAGAPTYRLPHHPRYSEIFSNPLYKPVWFKAFGRLRYTTLLSRPGGGFIIAPEPILDHNQTDMEESLSSMSSDLQAMALHMADDSGPEAKGKRKRHSALLTDELQAMRERSMSVQVAVLAGLGFESSSPRGSFTGPTSPFGRHRSSELPMSPSATVAGGAPARSAVSMVVGGASTGGLLVGGGAAGSAGSFSVLGSPGRSRLSCPAEASLAGGFGGVYAAIAADLAGGSQAADGGSDGCYYSGDPRSAADLQSAMSPGMGADAAGFSLTPSYAVPPPPPADGDGTSLLLWGGQDQLRAPQQQLQMHDPAAAQFVPAAAPGGASFPSPAHTPQSPRPPHESVIWGVGADGLRIQLVPVALPSGGLAYCPADSLPAGAVASGVSELSAPAHLQSQQQQQQQQEAAYSVPGPEGAGVTLAGGVGPADVELQLPAGMDYEYAQQQQQQQHEQTQLSGMMQPAASGLAQADPITLNGGASAVDIVGYLQSRAEAIFGQALGAPLDALEQFATLGGPASAAAGAEGGGVDSSTRRSSGLSFAVGLPLPPDGNMAVQPSEVGFFGVVRDNSAQQDAAATGVSSADASSAPGWMVGATGSAGIASVPLGCSLWDGVLAASSAATAGPEQTPGAANPEPPADVAQQAAYPGMLFAASPPPPAAVYPAFYPAVHLSMPESAPEQYPIVHLTTVEMPAGFAASQAPAESAGSTFTAVLLASTRAPAANTQGTEETGLWQQQQQQQHEAWNPVPEVAASTGAAAGWVAPGMMEAATPSVPVAAATLRGGMEAAVAETCLTEVAEQQQPSQQPLQSGGKERKPHKEHKHDSSSSSSSNSEDESSDEGDSHNTAAAAAGSSAGAGGLSGAKGNGNSNGKGAVNKKQAKKQKKGKKGKKGRKP